ncbi:FYN-binding protein 1 [Lampris incognitus]|uniref:FYN-binding protein 1 n=1 Tax=Lampris incognitus TaxID=2546036 RepID=UPI0024B5D034|nr:FYN-binding protein 1 [Lampris incognitus]
MDGKADVKAIMARFQAGGASGAEETSSSSTGNQKTALHPTLSSGPPVQPKKPVLESLSGSAVTIPPKSTVLKSTVSSTSAPEVRQLSKTKALASVFSNAQEVTNGNVKPSHVHTQQFPLKTATSQNNEHKSPIPKPPLHKPSLSSTLPESKPAFTKPPWVKESSSGSLSTPGSTLQKNLPPPQKPSSSIAKLRRQNDEVAGVNTDFVNKPFHTINSQPAANIFTAQSAFNKERDKTNQSEGGLKREGSNKLPLHVSNSSPPPKPPASKKPSLLKGPPGSSPQINSISSGATLGPKRNPLPNSLALGPAPAKPNRPPRVNLERFRGDGVVPGNGPDTLKKKPVFPLPIDPHPSEQNSHMGHPMFSTPPAPSLPPRHPATIIQPDEDENYDDVGLINSSPPPPPPPSTGHPSQRAKQEDDSDGMMYEDLDERWEEAAELKELKKRECEQKEEKKRLEAEKKEKKEREKREQEARKKFKLVGPLEVIHKGKARADSRGNKTDLNLKQGEWVDILRVQGNPEGKWLGRTQGGYFGYVKNSSVEIDLDSWKDRRGSVTLHQDYDPEVYDDIYFVTDESNNSEFNGHGVVLPPPPEEDGEIYDDVDPSLDIRVPPPIQFTAEGNSDQSGAVTEEEIYDDVDSQGFPPPPPVSSLPTLKAQTKAEEMDPKKQKKFKKEEKEFRKKFKHDGDIQVLYQLTVSPTLTNKKWSGKDLPIKPGETLDVIVKAVDDKFICRNEEGKFGYVLASHVAMEDGDIYDDIGDDCIYDND